MSVKFTVCCPMSCRWAVSWLKLACRLVSVSFTNFETCSNLLFMVANCWSMSCFFVSNSLLPASVWRANRCSANDRNCSDALAKAS